MISCSHISKNYGSLVALNDVSLRCPAGEVHGLVGVNGAGKSTLFKILLGLLTSNSGTVHIVGEGKKKVGGIIEKPSLYPYLSAQDNLRVFAKIQNAPHDSLSLKKSLLEVGLPPDRKDAVRTYSLGMKQRLGIAIALLNNPSCLLLDEPFSGLDPLGIESLKKLIRKLATDSQMAILISSHLVGILHDICTKLHVIRDGNIIKQDSFVSIVADCTVGYTIYGIGWEASKTIVERGIEVNGQSITVSMNVAHLNELLTQLTNERILITACRPIIDMQQLFNTNPV